MINLLKIDCVTLIALGILLGACQKSEILAQLTPVTVPQTIPASRTILQPQSQKKSGKVIGQAIDCDHDGQDNDFRVDYDDDGIPDDCIIGENTNVQNFYDISMKFLEQLTQGCEESTKTDGNITYVVCMIDDQPVKASEFLTDLGDGLSIWFEEGQVKAVQRSHNGEIFFFDNRQLTMKFENYGAEIRDNFSNEERNESEELAQTAYQRIFQVFDIR
ncbi:MAG: hypothetical protein AB3A66_15200 [Nodularia sp. CChRGM 3473]